MLSDGTNNSKMKIEKIAYNLLKCHYLKFVQNHLNEWWLSLDAANNQCTLVLKPALSGNTNRCCFPSSENI